VRFGIQDEVTARFKLGDGELTTGLRRPVGDMVTDGEMLELTDDERRRYS